MAGAGATVDALAPAFVETPPTRPMRADPELRSEVLRRIPAGRLGEVGEVGGGGRLSARPRAGLITGAVVPVDGGWTAW